MMEMIAAPVIVGSTESIDRITLGGVTSRPRSRRTIIGVDCDGVLASDRLLWRRMRERFPQHIPARYEELATFEWPRATAETEALCMELSADPAFMERLAPMPGAVEALRTLRTLGYRLHVVTARPECVREATWRWLARHEVADCVEAIHCVPGGPAKPPVARALGCAAFIEDNHTTAEAMGVAGLHSYLLDAPYNRLPNDASRRVPSWRTLLADLVVRVPSRVAAVPPANIEISA
ncbi:MAG TPA: hypothetical protein VFU88_22975 [Ktedonobacterales bacterium]|nr:hypothetical protein [Ktedonobacterales bacterium]